MGQRSRVELAPSPANPCSVDATLRYPFMSLHLPEAGISQSKGPVAGLSCLTKRRASRRQTSCVARTDILSSVTSMNRPPSPEPIRALVRNAMPNVVVESVSTLTTSQSQRVFSIKVSDGRTLSLRLAPLSSGLLRYEQWPILSEARLTRWIFRISAEQSAEHHDDESSKPETDKSSRNKRSSGESQGADPEVSPSAKRRMLSYLPNLVAHSSSPTELGLGFNIFEPTKGVPVSNLPTSLTAAERDLVDFQKGRLMRYISEFTSPNGKFGLAVATLEPSMSAEFQGTQQAGLGSDGMMTWRKAFHSLLEAILRDAEDLSVTISYETIRGHFYRLGHVLDAVTVPRLVVLDAAEDSNVLVSRSSDERGDASNPTTAPLESQITVTGLCDWSKCIFGDPLFATAFVQDTTPAFIRGFRKVPTPPSSPSRDDSTPDADITSVDISFIEDRENAQVRLLLYECYHATAAVVRQFYRPGADRSEQEIAARRRLTTVLSRLEGVGWEDEIVEA
ncbi:hypothetical protein F4809DRAFT_179918 [Biscogniauxia mediterranea]|nr:hypothetical protein F4809DRAFT_179918 [Biscogniauxia mediterranea]